MSDKKFGLIGKSLKHSYSKIIHQKLGDYSYELFEIAPEQLTEFAQKKQLDGYNVTIPYKKDIIPLLDALSEQAKAIGAVNTVVNREGKLLGYNTDFLGMKYMLERANISIKDRVVMILGSGGTSSTALAVCKSLNAKEVVVVSRRGEINYDNCYDIKTVDVIINTTPVGMFPNTNQRAVDIERFPNLKGVVDVIYNPYTTKLLFDARQKNIPCTNGLPMLVAQAKYAMDYFFDKATDDGVIERILKDIERQTQNVVLIGMPSSGKSSVGRELAKVLNREFIDIDLEIEKAENCSIPEIFATKGEEYFRRLEKETTLKTCALSSKVIATGGGVVKDKSNLFALKQNGKVVLLTRDIDKLLTEGRPLSKDKQAIKKLYEERKDLYELFADVTVANDGELVLAVKGVLSKL